MTKNTLILSALITAALSAPTMAADWFVGGSVGYQQNGYEAELDDQAGNDIEDSFSDEEMLYELRVGAYLNDNNRLYGTYSYNDDEFSQQQQFLLSYDYLIGLGDRFNIFIGATAGMNSIDPVDPSFSQGESFVWGVQTGVQFEITKNLSTELGYRYLEQDYDEEFADASSSQDFSLTDSQQIYLSVDYRF